MHFAQVLKFSPLVLRQRVIRKQLFSSSQNQQPNFVSIPVSEVAACVGKNAFKPSSEVFKSLWKRYSPKTFTGETEIDKQVAAFARCTPLEQNVMLDTVSYQATDAQDAQHRLNNAIGIITNSASINDDDKAKVLALLQNQVNTNHGTKTEDKIVETVAIEQGIKFKRSDELYKLPLGRIDGTDYVVRGKIDRLQEENGEMILVEVKTRMNKLFKEVRDYEYIQVQMYLQMLPGNIRKAKLIEQYMDQNESHWIDRDDDLWNNEIKPALLNFCVDLDAKMKQGQGSSGSSSTEVVAEKEI